MAVLQQQKLTGEQNLEKKSLGQPQIFGGASTQAETAKPPQQASSGRFVNLQKYLSASGPQAGQQIAQKIEQKGQEKTQQATKATTEAESVRQGIEQSKAKYADTGQPAVQGIQSVAQGTGNLNEDQSKQIQDLLQGGFIKEAEELRKRFDPAATQALSKVGQAQQFVQNVGTEAGRYNLLRDLYKRPQYSTGQQRLDQLLLQQQAPGGLRSLEKTLSTSLTPAQEMAQKISGVTGEDFSKIIESGAAGQKAVSEELFKGLGGLEKTAQERALARSTEAQDLQNQYRKIIDESGDGDVYIPPELAEKLGLGTEGSFDIFNALSQGPGLLARTFQAKDVISEDELGRYNTLAEFLGDKYNKQFSEAGDPNAGLIDRSHFDESLAKQQKQFEKMANEARSGYSSRIAHGEANLGELTLADYLKYGKDIERTAFGGKSSAELMDEYSKHPLMKLYPQLARDGAGTLARATADALKSRGIAQDISGHHLGDYNRARDAALTRAKQEFENLLKSINYGKKLVIGNKPV